MVQGGHGERAERESITGVWEQSPSGVHGQSPWSGDQGAKPPEAETLLVFGRSMKAANLPIFLKFGNAKTRDFCCLANGGHRTIPPLNTPLHKSLSGVPQRSPSGAWGPSPRSQTYTICSCENVLPPSPSR